jgi:hypothetical protein
MILCGISKVINLPSAKSKSSTTTSTAELLLLMTFFQWLGKMEEQTQATRLGRPSSPVMADLFIE